MTGKFRIYIMQNLKPPILPPILLHLQLEPRHLHVNGARELNFTAYQQRSMCLIVSFDKSRNDAIPGVAKD